MSKKVYEAKATADAAKRFRMLCEYSFNITEDDGEELPDNGEEIEPGTQGNSMAGDNQMPDMGAESGMQGDEEMQTDMQTDMQGDSINNGNGNGAPGFNPEMGLNTDADDTMNADSEPMQGDDEVIDVDDLTQSQEETEDKVDDIQVSMEKGFDKLLNIVSKLDKMIDASTANMEQIKKEIEKRNPTPIEKLNMRAANDSYPFNISPSDYWKEKESSSNYRIGGDDNDAEQYVITQGDIDKISDYRAISKDLNDSEFNQNLLNIFGLR